MEYQPGLLHAKAIRVEKQLWCYLTHFWEDKEFHTFPKIISVKVKIIVLLEFELAHSEAAVQHVSRYTSLNWDNLLLISFEYLKKHKNKN